MSYSIQYNPELTKKYPKPKIYKHIPVKHIILLAIVFASTYIFAYNGWLRIFLPGNPDVTASAFSTLVEQVVDGTPFKDAVYDFCEEIIADGRLQ